MTSANQTPATDDSLERYRIRYGLYKIVLGTALVGLAGVLVPGAVEYWKLAFEDKRKAVEAGLAQVNSQQAYVKDFLQTALNQDIELRIRFADYFAHVAAEPFKQDWIGFRDSLMKVRDTNRQKIHENESAIRKDLSDNEPDLTTQVQIAEYERKLEWLYREVGYVAKNRSIVRSKDEIAETEGGETDTYVSLPIAYSQDLVDSIIKTPGVPYPKNVPLPKPTKIGVVRGIVVYDGFGSDVGSVRLMREGRANLPGPFSNWAVLSDGTIEFIAKEGMRVIHLGRADRGLKNSNTIAIVVTGLLPFENELQIENLVRLVVDIADRWSVPTEMIVGKGEVVIPASRRRATMVQQAPVIRKMVEAVRKGIAAAQR